MTVVTNQNNASVSSIFPDDEGWQYVNARKAYLSDKNSLVIWAEMLCGETEKPVDVAFTIDQAEELGNKLLAAAKQIKGEA